MRVRAAVLASVVVGLLLVTPAAAVASSTEGVRVAGQVWLDLDGDGTRDDGEPGRGAVSVTLRTSASIIDAVTSGPDGTWTFDNVQAGSYQLVVEPPIDHGITGGTLPELDADRGEAALTVGSDDIADAGAVGIGSVVDAGPDVVTTVALDGDRRSGDPFRWDITVHNIGPGDADGPVGLRVVLSADHESTAVQGGDWTCDRSAAIVLCESPADLPAASSLPSLRLTTVGVGEVGAPLSVTATARLDGVFDAAPLNDEDSAAAAIGTEGAVSDTDGDGVGDLSNAGAATSGMLVAGLVAVVVGAASLRTSHRAPRRP